MFHVNFTFVLCYCWKAICYVLPDCCFFQLSVRGHEEKGQREDNSSTECSERGVMDLKFTSARKYVSISVPSKSQTMSPHIKSVDDVIVLGINLSKFNKPAQFFICVSGVFMFYLIYGYLQVNAMNLCLIVLLPF